MALLLVRDHSNLIFRQALCRDLRPEFVVQLVLSLGVACNGMMNSRSQSLSGCGNGVRLGDLVPAILPNNLGRYGMLWRLQILCRPTSDKPSFGASFESAPSQTIRCNSDRFIFFLFMENFTSTFEKPGGFRTPRHLSGSRVMKTGRSAVGGRVLRSPFLARSFRPAFRAKEHATCGCDGLNLSRTVLAPSNSPAKAGR